MYSRPVKRSNASTSESTARLIRKGKFHGVDDDIEDALATLHVAYPVDSIKDWNLTVAQTALRYRGMRDF